jgi:SAM-dependent methyltransferase
VPDSITEAVFTEIYRRNTWGDRESLSGPGSSVMRTRYLRPRLIALIAELDVRSVLDAGCGDFNWLRLAELPGVVYTGVDIVEALVAQNIERHSSPNRAFLKADLLSDPLPQADLIFCRDCLVHFSFEDIRRALANLKKCGATWLLATTFTALERNEDIETGGWRPLHLQLAPLGFPAPVRAIEDGPRPDGSYPDKILALYRMSEIS